MKKILITGNSGYIGSHLTAHLRDYSVYGLDLRDPEIEVTHFYYADIRELYKISVEFDTVVHLAALVNVGESQQIPTEYYATNLIGTMNVLTTLNFKNFIFASTGAAVKCESAYGVSKRAAEDVVREFCTAKKVPFTIFRFYNVIGSTCKQPTNPDGLFYNLIKSVDSKKFSVFGNDYPTKDGTCVRDYVHVNEICEAIRLAIETPSNQIENLGHGVGHTVNEIIEIFEKVNGVSIDVSYSGRRDGDIDISVLDNPSSYMKSIYPFEQLLALTK